MSEPLFRPCKDCDIETLQNLVTNLYLEDANLSHGHPNVQISWQELNAKPDKGQVVIFDVEGEIAGYAILIFFWSNEYAGDIIEIDEIYVDKKFRCSGVATKFFSWVERTFAETCAGWSLQVSQHNQNALRLYERLGYKPSANRHLVKIKNA